MGIERSALRKSLLEQRRQFAQSPHFEQAASALCMRLCELLAQVNPRCLGLYWPIQGEFDAAQCVMHSSTWALPFAQRDPTDMHYRAWNGKAPALKDECGIPASDGIVVEPDTVLVPCVGYTRSCWRLGYGAGYFDRWLATRPEVVTIGIAWSIGEIDAADFAAQAHDRPLSWIVTEKSIVTG